MKIQTADSYIVRNATQKVLSTVQSTFGADTGVCPYNYKNPIIFGWFSKK